MGLQDRFLAPEHSAQARALDFEPERRDRAADDRLLVDALRLGYVPGQTGNSLRTYQHDHGLAVMPRSNDIGIESVDETIPRRSDLLYLYIDYPKPPPSASHRSVCTACRRRSRAAYNSVQTPRARWRDEEAHLAQVADASSNLTPKGDLRDAWRFIQGLRSRGDAAQARTFVRAVAREALPDAVVEHLEREVVDFELIQRVADGYSIHSIGYTTGLGYSRVYRRLRKARRAVLDHLTAIRLGRESIRGEGGRGRNEGPASPIPSRDAARVHAWTCHLHPVLPTEPVRVTRVITQTVSSDRTAA